MKGLHRDSKPALAVKPADQAWWYEDENSISVHCYQVNGPTFSCVISRRSLESYIRRAKAMKKRKVRARSTTAAKE